jgi:PhzF family phenazine biosynthesis protein
MPRLIVYQIDSFTRERFSGNPAGVVLSDEAPSELQMQRIARELNNSETAFVLPPEGPDQDLRIRFFTPRVEVPVCGHATVAAHYARAVEYGTGPVTLTQMTGAGPMTVQVLREGEDYRVRMTQGAVVFEPPLPEGTAEEIREALGLRREDRDGRTPIQVVSTGHSKVMVPVLSRSALEALAPDMSALTELSRRIGCNGYFAFTRDAPDPGCLTRGRMFAPAVGVPEDPVTGNAHGPLGAYLVRHGLAPRDRERFLFRGSQGDSTGRSGHMDVEVEIRDGEASRVSILGDAVVVFRCEIDL